MIRSLRIENFALIDATTINFEGGFTVITGETGSGKSILLNALNLILGQRANFSVIGEKKDKSIVEAEIDIKNFNLKSFFEENELDYFDTAIVRREIYKQGRSRAFINDSPVHLNVLKEFSSGLIHIHSQYNTLELKDKDFQLHLLDVLASSLKSRDEYHNLFLSYQKDRRSLNTKTALYAESSTKKDFDSFQLEELQSLKLSEVDYEGMQNDLKKFENAEELISSFASLTNLLESDGGVLDQLNQVNSTLKKNASMDSVLQALQNRVESVLIELRDISGEAEEQSGKVDIEPQKLAELTSQLDAYNKIRFKHNVQTQDELMEMMNSLSCSSSDLLELKQEIDQLTSKLEKSQVELLKKAKALNAMRLKYIPTIEKQITDSLNDLKLENTVLEFKLTETEELKEYGNSALEIMFSPNPGIPIVPIHQAASGGELSRVMLALQSLMSKKTQLQTILFDEIDTGVSGDVAQKIGNTLKSMGEGMQVIAITHLPQVAAKGVQHLSVSKTVENGMTNSSVRELSLQERIEETARLMSGDTIDESALSNARALMS